MENLVVERRPREEGREEAEAFPARFGWPGFMREVVEVLDWWPGSDRSYFKVRGSDGSLYILSHDEAGDRWGLVVFELGGEHPKIRPGHLSQRPS